MCGLLSSSECLFRNEANDPGSYRCPRESSRSCGYRRHRHGAAKKPFYDRTRMRLLVRLMRTIGGFIGCPVILWAEIRPCGAGILIALEVPVNSRLGKINSRFGGKKFPVMSRREFS